MTVKATQFTVSPDEHQKQVFEENQVKTVGAVADWAKRNDIGREEFLELMAILGLDETVEELRPGTIDG